MKKVILTGNEKDIDTLLRMERVFIKQKGILIKEEKSTVKKEVVPVDVNKELKVKVSNKSK